MIKTASNVISDLALSYKGFVGTVPTPEKWVFIVGCYNSGTTLLHDILAGHNDIGSLPVEGQVCSNQFVSPKSLNLPRLWAAQADKFHIIEDDLPPKIATRLKRQWGHRFNYPKRSILLEKSITNAARIRWLNQQFDNAYFISIIRNGYAVAEGIHRKANHSLTLAARQWATSNKIMMTDLEKIPRKINISYEAFTQNPSATLNDIAQFMGIDDSFTQKDVSSQTWNIHGVKNKIRNMNQASLDRLTVNDKRLIENEALDLLAEFNYHKTI